MYSTLYIYIIFHVLFAYPHLRIWSPKWHQSPKRIPVCSGSGAARRACIYDRRSTCRKPQEMARDLKDKDHCDVTGMMVRIEVTIPRPSSFMWAKHFFPDKWSSMRAWTTFCLFTFLFIQDEHVGLVMICCLLLLITVSQDPLCHWRVISVFTPWWINGFTIFFAGPGPHTLCF